MPLFNAHWQVVACDEETVLHTEENGYCCGDPMCICADAEEGDGQVAIFLKSTEEALRDLRESR